VFNKFVFIYFVLFTQNIFSSSPAIDPSSVTMCATDQDRPSSVIFRKWIFDLLKRSGNEKLHNVTLINSKCHNNHTASACVAAKKIYFDEKTFNEFSLGVKFSTLAHELVHILQEHNPDIRKVTIDDERCADIEGARLGNCQSCTQEVAHYYLTNQTVNHPTISQLKANHSELPETIESFSEATTDQQKKYLDLAKQASKGTHPCGPERAYYFYALSQSAELKGKFCMFHQEIIDQKNQRLELFPGHTKRLS